MQFIRRKSGDPSRDFPTFEHLTRRDEGGTMDLDNIVLAHYKCNIRRNADDMKKRKAARKRPSHVAPCPSAGKRTPPTRAASDARDSTCRAPEQPSAILADHEAR